MHLVQISLRGLLRRSERLLVHRQRLPVRRPEARRLSVGQEAHIRRRPPEQVRAVGVNGHGIAARQRLSQAALEVLAIAAHRQPVTLPEINFIRGANSASVVRTLLERKLLRLAGRKKVVGKPFLYRTSKEFLVHFGLERPEDLPDPEELVRDEAAPVD